MIVTQYEFLVKSCIVVMTKIKTFSNQNEVSLDVIYVR